MQHSEMGDFAAVGFLWYRLKHSENNKDNNQDFWSFLIIKFECPDQFWKVRCHFKAKKAHIHQIENLKLTPFANFPPFDVLHHK